MNMFNDEEVVYTVTCSGNCQGVFATAEASSGLVTMKIMSMDKSTTYCEAEATPMNCGGTYR